MKHNRRRSPRSSRRSSSVLDRIQIDVAGIDCGSAEHYVSVPPDRDPTPIQSFRTFTADLERLADWLVACRITSVAMEATGVYGFDLRHPRSAGSRGPARQRPAHQTRPRPQERCRGL